MNELSVFTWIGAACLGVCAIPQAWDAFKNPRSTKGLSWWFLIIWGVGELSMFTGLINAVSPHVLLNYMGNGLLISYILGVKFAHRKEHREYHG